MYLRTCSIIGLALLVTNACAQVAVWGQCGGIGFSGGTTCAAGSTCVFVNAYYSQCQPGAATSAPVTTTAQPTTTGGSTAAPAPTGSGLNALAKSIGKIYFGSATDNPELSDSAYVSILSNSNMFGQLTPGNSMKWDATEPSRGSFSYSGGDTIVKLAQANGQIVRGHNLVWHSQLPSWVANGGFDNATLISIMENHITNLATHWKGQVRSWDVVNEPFNDDGSMESSGNPFYTTIGAAYIPIALRAARAADPNAKLCLNDYNIEGPGAKATAMINLVRNLKAQGVPIDCIGIESHLIVGSVPSQSQLQANWEAMAALGVEVQITELDIRMTLPSTQQKLTQQATDYATVINACVAVEGCVGITIWDYTDKYSWVPQTFSGQGDACPWDSNLQPKPAYTAIANAL